MGHMLCHIQQTPGFQVFPGIPEKMDFKQEIGQFLMRPITVFTSYNFTDYTLLHISVAHKVMTLVLSVLLLPLTALGILIGMALLKASSTHRLMSAQRILEQEFFRMDSIVQSLDRSDEGKLAYGAHLNNLRFHLFAVKVEEKTIAPLFKRVYPTRFQEIVDEPNNLQARREMIARAREAVEVAEALNPTWKGNVGKVWAASISL